MDAESAALMDALVYTPVLARSLAATAIGWLILTGYRAIRRRSAVLGAVVGTAILGRAGLGLALFWTSYLTLPIGEAFQIAGGFWQPALDATGYFQYAAAAAETWTLYPLDHRVPAPVFVDVLALWMGGVGISHAAGMFLNLALFTGVTVLIVRSYRPANDWRRDLPCIIAVAAYAFSPIGLFHSTQPMKEDLFVGLVALGCLGLLALGPLAAGATPALQHRAVLLGGTVIAAAVLGMSGLRWYVAFMMWCCLAMALSVVAVWRRETPFRRYAGGSIVVLAAKWIGFWAAAGPYYRQVGPTAASLLDYPAHLWNTAQMARSGFLRSGGASNITLTLRDEPDGGQARAARIAAAQRAWWNALREGNPQAPAAPRDPRLQAAIRLEAQRADAQVTAAERLRVQRRGPAAADAAAEPPPVPASRFRGLSAAAARGIPVSGRDHLPTVASGLALIFLPLPAAGALTGIAMPGGTLVALSGLDTIFFDVSLAAMFVLLWRRRHLVGNRMLSVVFCVSLAGSTTILLGYVVTNFGTLLRMRASVAIPLWMLCLAIAPRVEPATSPASAPRRERASPA